MFDFSKTSNTKIIDNSVRICISDKMNEISLQIIGKLFAKFLFLNNFSEVWFKLSFCLLLLTVDCKIIVGISGESARQSTQRLA